jgi:predicted Zn-dependent peptidase
MPIGKIEDINKADFEKLKKKHSDFYHESNAALIIFTPHNKQLVDSMVNDIFCHNKLLINDDPKIEHQNHIDCCVMPKTKALQNVQSYVLLAWYPRQILPDLATLETYILLATLARAIEIALSEKEGLIDPECNVEVFNHNNYMFKLDMSTDLNTSVNDLLEIVNNTEFTTQLFVKAKKLVRKQLSISNNESFTKMQIKDLIDSCRENFLFGEPFINMEDEYEKSLDFINNLRNEKVKKDFSNIIEQFSVNKEDYQN